MSLPGIRHAADAQGLRTLIVGAGEAGRTLAKALRRSPNYGLVPIGFLDDAHALTRALGLPVYRPIQALPEVARAQRADACVVAIPSLPARRFAEIVDTARAGGLHVRYLPSFLAAVERDARLSDLRQLRVESLLGRREVHVVSQKAATLISGRRVLVTGAGGSIGSELCRQIRGFGPARLYLLDHDESNLHRLQLEITGNGLLDSDEIIIADIRDQRRIDQVFAATRPELVFHAAAHKHLPLLERHACEAVKSNVRGTQHVVQAAVQHGSSRFVLISTDKAADPASVLGASKRLAELVVQRDGRRAGHAGLGPLRQRPGQPGIIPVRAGRPDRPRPAGHRHPPGRHPVLHDGGGSRRAGAGDRGDGRVRRDIRPRHGRAGAHREPGPQLRTRS